jgi:TolB-like protein
VAKKSVISQLKERRVIRATLIYVALLWVALQVANVLEEAGFVSEQLVRGLILLGVGGLIATILASWFLESPWKQEKWISVAGDVVIIVAVTLAAVLFAWQQWFTSFSRPTVAILKIEATDTRGESEDLAAHLALRLRNALATRAEIRVVELSSSQHSLLEGRTVADKAESLRADFLITGTVAQGGSEVRLNLQLFTADANLLFGETYEDRLLDLAQLQNRVLADLWSRLPLPADEFTVVRNMIAECEYPQDRGALLTIAAVDNGKLPELTEHIEQFDDAGMLHLARAKILFAGVATAEPTRKSVQLQIAMQSATTVEDLCPTAPEPHLLRLMNTMQSVSDELLRRYPNETFLYLRASHENSHADRANALLGEARLLDPLGDW